MLNIIALIILVLSLSFTFLWRNMYNGIAFNDATRRTHFENKSKYASLATTIAGFIFTAITWSSGWHSIWGVGAVLSAAWGVAYFYLCHKRGISPFKGTIVENKFLNFFLTEFVFSYFYIFTWVQLSIMFLPLFQ